MIQDETARKKPSLSPVRVLVCVVLLASVFYATRSYTLPIAGRWLNVAEEPTYSDYALVLNGDLETRPFAAADLYRRGKVGRILIMSVQVSPRRTGPEVHAVVRSVLNKCNVPDSDISLLDRRCDTTFDEATTLAEFLEQNPDDSVNVVTNEYHTRRTRWVFRQVLNSKISRVRFASARTDHFNASNWWQNENGFVLYMSEFFKFGFYLVRYGYGLVYVAATIGLVSVGYWFRRRRLLVASDV